jgi:hypothetical protein
MEGHMTLHLENKIQNPGTMRQGGVPHGENRWSQESHSFALRIGVS